MGRIIGIDLGTTNSVAAIVDGPQPRVLDNKQNRGMTRSVVGISRRKGREELLIGEPALRNWELAPEDTIVSVKRLMGRGFSDDEVKRVMKWAQYRIVEPSDGTKDGICIVMGGKEYTPVDVSAMILKQIKEEAEFRLGEEVTHAVITVPAYFSQIQRAATRRAGLKAGLKVIKVLEEPTAAAIAFGINTENDTQPRNLLVYDLGGGTFDISALMWAGNVFVPLNLKGDMWLGGDNFDEVLVKHVVAWVKKEYDIDTLAPTPEMRRFMVALKRGAQETKEQLSAAETADLIVAGLLHDKDGDLIDVTLEITRSEFEKMIAPLVARTVQLTLKAVEEAGLSKDQINYVLMAGNSTCIPLVQKSMEDLFGPEKVLRKVHPKHSVALGAAVLARQLSKIVCQNSDPAEPSRECGYLNELDATECAKCGRALQAVEAVEGGVEPRPIIPPVGIAQYPYGTQSAGDKFNIFVEKGEPFPTVSAKVLTFYTRTPGQRMISIPVYGGENLEKASANEKQGESFAILPPNLPQNTPVYIQLSLDNSGCFAVTAHLEDGTDLNPWIIESGADAKAVQIIQQVEETLVRKQSQVPPHQLQVIEEARNAAFDRLRHNDFGGAISLAQEADRLVREGGEQEADPLRHKAEQLMGFTEYVLQEYNWALQSHDVMRLTRVLDETRRAIETNDRGLLEQRVRELDAATDNLPNVVRGLLAAKGAIAQKVMPVDPAEAAKLLSEIEDIERECRAGRLQAAFKLKDIEHRIVEAIRRAEAASAGGGKCANCGMALQGQRICPKCGEDSWVLTDKVTQGKITSF